MSDTITPRDIFDAFIRQGSRGFTATELETLFGVSRNRFSRVLTSGGFRKALDGTYHLSTTIYNDWLVLSGAVYTRDKPLEFKSAVAASGFDLSFVESMSQSELRTQLLNMSHDLTPFFEKVASGDWSNASLNNNLLATYAMFYYMYRLCNDKRRDDPDLRDIATGKVA